MINEKTLSIDKAAQYIGVSRSTMLKLIGLTKLGQLHPPIEWFRLYDGAPYHIIIDSLNRYLESRRNA